MNGIEYFYQFKNVEHLLLNKMLNINFQNEHANIIEIFINRISNFELIIPSTLENFEPISDYLVNSTSGYSAPPFFRQLYEELLNVK